jgi:hypothetical protein
MSAQYLTGTTDEFAEQKMNSRTTIQTAADAHAIRAIHQRMIEAWNASDGAGFAAHSPTMPISSRGMGRI